jgi:hypothetical protein
MGAASARSMASIRLLERRADAASTVDRPPGDTSMGKVTIVHHPPGNPSPFAKAMVFLGGSWIPRPASTTIGSGPTRRRRAVWAFALTAGVSAAPACATGPKDTLSGNWTGSGFSLSLRQSGSRVTGTSCTVVPVSGSVHGSDFEMAIDTGAAAVDYTGGFVNATTILINQTGNVNVAVGGITLYKGAPSLSADCIYSQQ